MKIVALFISAVEELKNRTYATIFPFVDKLKALYAGPGGHCSMSEFLLLSGVALALVEEAKAGHVEVFKNFDESIYVPCVMDNDYYYPKNPVLEITCNHTAFYLLEDDTWKKTLLWDIFFVAIDKLGEETPIDQFFYDFTEKRLKYAYQVEREVKAEAEAAAAQAASASSSALPSASSALPSVMLSASVSSGLPPFSVSSSEEETSSCSSGKEVPPPSLLSTEESEEVREANPASIRLAVEKAQKLAVEKAQEQAKGQDEKDAGTYSEIIARKNHAHEMMKYWMNEEEKADRDLQAFAAGQLAKSHPIINVNNFFLGAIENNGTLTGPVILKNANNTVDKKKD
mgnify:FL=1